MTAILESLLELCEEYGASDLHLTAGFAPRFRIHGYLVEKGGFAPFDEKAVDAVATELGLYTLPIGSPDGTERVRVILMKEGAIDGSLTSANPNYTVASGSSVEFTGVLPGTYTDPKAGTTRTVLGQMTYGIWNEDAYQLYMDLETLRLLIDQVDPESLRADHLAAAEGRSGGGPFHRRSTEAQWVRHRLRFAGNAAHPGDLRRQRCGLQEVLRLRKE